MTTEKRGIPPFQSFSKFGHMSSLYDQDQKKVQKLELHLSYTTCDEMIKIPPTERGLIGLKINFTLDAATAVETSTTICLFVEFL